MSLVSMNGYGRALVLLLCCGLGGCTGDPEPAYFPLMPDLRWHYEITETTRLGTRHRDYAVTNIGRVAVGHERLPARRTSSGTDYYFRVDTDAIRRVAKRLIVELEPQPDVPERTVLPLPPAPGREWQASTRPYVLRRLVEDGVNFSRGYVLPMSYAVVATDETVTVPAGTFEHCVKVVGNADLRMYVDGLRGLGSIPLTTEEWYAPGIGLVRLVRTESVESDMMTGGTLTMELAHFDTD